MHIYAWPKELHYNLAKFEKGEALPHLKSSMFLSEIEVGSPSSPQKLQVPVKK